MKVQGKIDGKVKYVKYRGVSDFRSLITYYENIGYNFLWLNFYDEKTKEQKGSFTNRNPP